MGSSVLPSPICGQAPLALRNGLVCSCRVAAAQQSSLFSSSASRLRLPRTTMQSRPSLGRYCARFSAEDPSDEMTKRTLNSGSGRKLGPGFGSLECEEKRIEEERSGRDLSSSEASFTLLSVAPVLVFSLIADGPGYSQIVKKTFALPGPKEAEGKLLSQIAGEITSSLGRSNFAIADRGETVTFEGTMMPSRGQAAFLSFCTAVSLGCVALVLSITVPDVGENWYYLTILSPLAGFYYWTRASRKEQIKVKMVVSDDESSTDVIIQGDDEQIDRLRRELGLMEKGMVYVKGLLER